jgi:hypothetical protein
MITTGKGPDPRIEINAGTGEVARSSGTFVEIHLRNVYGKEDVPSSVEFRWRPR